MRAAIINRFGSSEVLEVTDDFPKPSIADNQVLIRLKAAGINPLDWKIRKGMLRMVLGSQFPMVLGNDAAGIIVECGRNVKEFRPGDRVFCMLDANKKSSRSGFAKSGAYAEFAATRAETLSVMPETLTFEEAASIPLCALSAYQALVHKAEIKWGDKILINGASGGVGIHAIQIAKYLGAHVTAVCGPSGIELVKRLGADSVIDYTKSNFIETKEQYDLIYDITANTSYKKCKNALTDRGIYITNLASPLVFLFPFLRKRRNRGKNRFVWVEPLGIDLQIISAMVENGQLEPVIDSVFPLEEIRAAHERSEKGKPAGKIVVRI